MNTREAQSPHCMAATSQPLATQTALKTMKQGGSAVDAAIAANAVLAVTEPTGCGLGGDLFAFVWCQENQKLFGYNGSGRSPHSLTRDHLLNLNLNEIPNQGHLPISVPGCVQGWENLHERFGILPIKDLLQEAIGIAQNGFPVTPVIAKHWELGSARLKNEPGFSEIFLPNRQSPKAGEIFRNPSLARTLETLGQDGLKTFYHGDIAEKINRYIKDIGGYLNKKDLSSHSGEWIDPISTKYHSYDIWQTPPNSQGLAVLQMLNLFECCDLESIDFNSPEFWHLFIEIKKIVYEDRARWYGDPNFSRIPIEELLSRDYAKNRLKNFNPKKSSSDLDPGDPQLKTSDTTYLTTADSKGNMVSWIQSNYMGFGSGVTIPELGFCFQNRGQLFHLNDPQHPNVYAPGKRAFNTIIPGFVTLNGKPTFSFGVMGGDYQPVGQVQILQNIFHRKMDTQEAGNAPRIHHLGSSSPTGTPSNNGGTVIVEKSFPESLCRSLEDKGHRVKQENPLVFGGYQGIWKEKSYWKGASEPRKDGFAQGF